jgi:hypothetical protein
MRNKLLTILLVVGWVVCVILLVSGLPLLGVSLIGQSFPVGTLITWIGLVALPLALFTAFPGLRNPVSGADKFFRLLLLVILILAGLWGLFAFLLSGNWAFTFDGTAQKFSGSEQASRLFWKITYLIVSAEWFFILIYMFSKWIIRLKNLSKRE